MSHNKQNVASYDEPLCSELLLEHVVSGLYAQVSPFVTTGNSINKLNINLCIIKHLFFLDFGEPRILLSTSRDSLWSIVI
jgi:hypothetical protein